VTNEEFQTFFARLQEMARKHNVELITAVPRIDAMVLCLPEPMPGSGELALQVLKRRPSNGGVHILMGDGPLQVEMTQAEVQRRLEAVMKSLPLPMPPPDNN
jgi:hypothetical protein